MSKEYSYEERYKPLMEITFALNLGGIERQVYIGFDSGAPGKEVAERIGSFVEACGIKAISDAPGVRHVDPPIVIIISVYGGSSIPEEIVQTVHAEGRTCKVRAKTIPLASMSLDDLIVREFYMFFPFYFSKYEEFLPEMEGDQKNRAALLEDLRRVITILSGDLPHAFDGPELLSVTKELLEAQTADCPEVAADIQKMFDSLENN